MSTLSCLLRKVHRNKGTQRPKIVGWGKDLTPVSFLKSFFQEEEGPGGTWAKKSMTILIWNKRKSGHSEKSWGGELGQSEIFTSRLEVIMSAFEASVFLRRISILKIKSKFIFVPRGLLCSACCLPFQRHHSPFPYKHNAVTSNHWHVTSRSISPPFFSHFFSAHSSTYLAKLLF